MDAAERPGRPMACAPVPAPRSPLSRPSTLTRTQGAAASAAQGCLAAPRATAATGRPDPRAPAAAARRVGHRPAAGGGLRLHVHGARRLGRRVVRACACAGARARLRPDGSGVGVYSTLYTCACACTCTCTGTVGTMYNTPEGYLGVFKRALISHHATRVHAGGCFRVMELDILTIL